SCGGGGRLGWGRRRGFWWRPGGWGGGGGPFPLLSGAPTPRPGAPPSVGGAPGGGRGGGVWRGGGAPGGLRRPPPGPPGGAAGGPGRAWSCRSRWAWVATTTPACRMSTRPPTTTTFDRLTGVGGAGGVGEPGQGDLPGRVHPPRHPGWPLRRQGRRPGRRRLGDGGVIGGEGPVGEPEP